MVEIEERVIGVFGRYILICSWHVPATDFACTATSTVPRHLTASRLLNPPSIRGIMHTWTSVRGLMSCCIHSGDDIDFVESIHSPPPLECMRGALMRSTTFPPLLICPPINEKPVDVGSYHSTHHRIVLLRIPTETNHSGTRRKPGPEVASRPFPAAKRVRVRPLPCVCESRVLEVLDVFRADMNDLQSRFELEAVVLDLKD